MVFWGVEVRPGKPYAHRLDQSSGRLRISQAALGDGKSTSKSTVQCNVGQKSPVLLCNLIPNVSETCHLELEFEEDEEVVFSVLGQRSIHLSGYYCGTGRKLDGDDSESYGEDVAVSDDSDSYSHGSEDDEYESDFIDDDDAAMHKSSHARKSSVVIEEILDDDQQCDLNGSFRRLKKKHEISDSEEGDAKSKQLIAKNKGIMKVESEDEDGFPVCFTVSRSSKRKKLSDDKRSNADDISQDNPSVSDALEDHEPAKPTEFNNDKKSKKKKGMEENHLIESDKDEKHSDANNCEATTIAISDDPKASKHSKKKPKKTKVKEEAASDEKVVHKDGIMDGENLTKEDEMNTDIPISNANDVVKKKKKKKKSDSEIKPELANGNAELGSADDKVEAIKTRTFSNGLVVEEVSMGKPDGKKASPGKKVSVKYIGKLKNGTIFDSNINERPFKFRLGIGEVIKGWDIGVSGMRVGDKRRITIPPSMGYGEKGVGKIPPKSWLVFDVELIDVI